MAQSRLIASPRHIRLGRKGTRSEYPPETGRQLLALCRLRRRFPHDLDAIRFGLWYVRYRIPIDDVKQSMVHLGDHSRTGANGLLEEILLNQAFNLPPFWNGLGKEVCNTGGENVGVSY